MLFKENLDRVFKSSDLRILIDSEFKILIDNWGKLQLNEYLSRDELKELCRGIKYALIEANKKVVEKENFVFYDFDAKYFIDDVQFFLLASANAKDLIWEFERKKNVIWKTRKIKTNAANTYCGW